HVPSTCYYFLTVRLTSNNATGGEPCSPSPTIEKDPYRMTKLSKAEQEVHLMKCADEDHWALYVTDQAALPAYLALAEKVGGRVVEHQGGTKIILPEDSVLLTARRKLNLSSEQRALRAEQMKARRATKTCQTSAPA